MQRHSADTLQHFTTLSLGRNFTNVFWFWRRKRGTASQYSASSALQLMTFYLKKYLKMGVDLQICHYKSRGHCLNGLMKSMFIWYVYFPFLMGNSFFPSLFDSAAAGRQEGREGGREGMMRGSKAGNMLWTLGIQLSPGNSIVFISCRSLREYFNLLVKVLNYRVTVRTWLA